MAATVDDITNVSGQSGKEESATMAKLAVSSHQDSDETLSANSWGLENGSLPVAVPSKQQAGPGFHHVESSTTDSGVSNPSSVTSDSIPQLPAGETSLAAAELQLELRTVERALHGLGLDDSGQETCVSEHPGLGEGRRGEGKGECPDLCGDNINESLQLHVPDVENTTKRE